MCPKSRQQLRVILGQEHVREGGLYTTEALTSTSKNCLWVTWDVALVVVNEFLRRNPYVLCLLFVKANRLQQLFQFLYRNRQ